MESSRNIKSHLRLQEPSEFPPTEAILYEERLEMTFWCKIELRIYHPLGSLGQTQGLGLQPAGPSRGRAAESARVTSGPLARAWYHVPLQAEERGTEVPAGTLCVGHTQTQTAHRGRHKSPQ